MTQEAQKAKFIEALKTACNEIGFSDVIVNENGIKLWLSNWTGSSLHLTLEDDKVEFYFYQRTTSWAYNGERTDLQESISIFLALFLRISTDANFSLFTLENPATNASDEIYAQYIIPSQVPQVLSNYGADSNIEAFKNLILSLKFFEEIFWKCFDGCPCEECRTRLGIEFDYRELEPSKVLQFSKATGKSKNINSIERGMPTWEYFRNFDKATTIIRSPSLVSSFKSMVEKHQKGSGVLSGINGWLHTAKNIKNFYSFKAAKKIDTILSDLEGQKGEFPKIPFDNRILGFSNSFLVIKNVDCVGDFKKERDLLKERNKKEISVLFADTIEWQESIDATEFENLIAELLKLEPLVTKVRKLSKTNEPDGGKDLLAEIKAPLDHYTKEESPTYQTKNIIVQCKAFKKGIGKSDVTDIRDMIEYYNCDGYFLIVSSHVKRSVSDYLIDLKLNKKKWIDWWCKEDIEERLQKNPDLILKFGKVFKQD